MKEILRKWDNGETLQSIEMGGIGPGYEQAIQVGIFEVCRDLLDKTLPEEKEELNALFDNTIHRTIKRVGGLLDGLSGAQAGAIKQVAYRFLSKGYEETVMTIPKDRMILVDNKLKI